MEGIFSVLVWKEKDQPELQACTFAQIWEKDKEIPIPNTKEARDSIPKLNNNRAPGPDDLKAEIFKTEEEKSMRRLWKVVQNIWMEGRIPR
jgi:hypothetical protein